ncbi:MAG: hypothetical protein ACK5XL_02670 [Cyclobacteriaceae bacterium]|jgi:hypothetical protein
MRQNDIEHSAMNKSPLACLIFSSQKCAKNGKNGLRLFCLIFLGRASLLRFVF